MISNQEQANPDQTPQPEGDWSYSSTHFTEYEIGELIKAAQAGGCNDKPSLLYWLSWCERIATSNEVLDMTLDGKLIVAGIAPDGEPKFAPNPNHCNPANN